MHIDQKSQAYQDFAGFMFQLLTEASESLVDDRFWEMVEEIDWPTNSNGRHPPLARDLAERRSLEETVAATVTAFDRRWEVEETLSEQVGDQLREVIPSEDGVDDFCFHLVGMGRDFYERIAEDASAAMKIATEKRYVESFRYVFEGAFPHYPYDAYQRLLTSWFQVVSPAEAQDPDWGTVLDLGEGLLGLVVRRDAGSLQVVTPLGEQSIAWPLSS